MEETQHPSKPSLTDKDWLWRDGLTWLSKSTGKPEQRARSQMGEWLRDAKEDAAMLRSVFEAAQAGNVFEPIAWITAAIKSRAQQAAPFEPTDDHGWRKRFDAFNETDTWLHNWGGTHPGDDPRHPPQLLKKYGFEVAA